MVNHSSVIRSHNHLVGAEIRCSILPKKGKRNIPKGKRKTCFELKNVVNMLTTYFS